MLRGADKEINTPNVADVMKVTLMIGDIRLLEEQTGVAGDVYIFDASVATPSHFAKFTPALVKKFLICVQVKHSLTYMCICMVLVKSKRKFKLIN